MWDFIWTSSCAISTLFFFQFWEGERRKMYSLEHLRRNLLGVLMLQGLPLGLKFRHSSSRSWPAAFSKVSGMPDWKKKNHRKDCNIEFCNFSLPKHNLIYSSLYINIYFGEEVSYTAQMTHETHSLLLHYSAQVYFMFSSLLSTSYGFTTLFQFPHIIATVAFWLMRGILSTLTRYLTFPFYFKTIWVSFMIKRVHFYQSVSISATPRFTV